MKRFEETESMKRIGDELLNFYFVTSSVANIVLALVVVVVIFFSTSPTLAYGDQIIEKTLPIIAMAESSNRPWVVSPDGGYGLYQISAPCLKHYNKVHETKLTLGNMKNPILGKRVATWYLQYLKKRLGTHYNQKTLVLAYNWGFEKVRKNQYIIPNWARKHPNRIYRQVFLAKL